MHFFFLFFRDQTMQLDWIKSGGNRTLPGVRWLSLCILLSCFGTSLSLRAEEVPTESLSTTTSTVDNSSATDAGVTADVLFVERLTSLVRSSLPKRSQAVSALVQLDDNRTFDILEALQQGSLYANTRGELYVAIQRDNQQFNVIDGEAFSTEIRSELKRVPINNTLRTQLRSLLAQLNLNHKEPAKRLSAVKRMIADGVEESSINLLLERQKIEANDAVREHITTAVALFNLHNNDAHIRLDAVQILRASLLPEVRSNLETIASNDPDNKVKQQAQKALNSIDDRIATFRLAENIFFGLSLGSVLLLSAIGLSITFGVMGVINMAHGELMMIGAYVTWVVQQLFPNQIAYSLMIAIPSAFIVAGLVGIAIERGVIRFLYGRPLETLLATFGLSLILQQAARSIFSPLNRAVELPAWMSGSLEINPVLSITYNRLYIFIFGLLVFFALLAILKKTSLGLKVRAVSQNRAMARAVGVRASWVDAMTFGLGSGIAGIAGVALSQLTNVGPNLGQAYIIDSFMVVVFGGVGNLWGTLVGAMGLGIINKFLEPYAGAVLAKVLVLVLLILFIQKRPKGLFPQKGRAAAD
ncbi:Branched-chain amino acid transport system / permease component domain protein [Cellvibrio japonicus Ueda107]|uniref:Branched-chain amino acid transport system / permease component domain protein n=2 Tax=Cellvibrio japonicus TaxID=155077 RepID=B3PCC4_CELJU|nr:Branched-chain amino acid transport system / permease component domain protein [Cellvibrio japonicus Ueda107]